MRRRPRPLTDREPPCLSAGRRIAGDVDVVVALRSPLYGQVDGRWYAAEERHWEEGVLPGGRYYVHALGGWWKAWEDLIP